MTQQSDEQRLADWVACLALDPDLTIAPLLGVETVEPPWFKSEAVPDADSPAEGTGQND